MLFNSLSYVLFLPTVVGIYFMLPHRLRWILLLVASYFFYMSWRAEYALLILLSTAVDYFAALKMGDQTTPQKRRPFLWLSLATNLGLLLTFKYAGFAFASLNLLLEPLQIAHLPTLQWVLPVGISFYTFQTLSYTLDVYRGRITPERHFGRFAVYVSFFPQLVAGPIERADALLPQLHTEQGLRYTAIVHGLRRILIGLFKKVVIADFLAHYVDLVYARPDDFAGSAVILATVLFALQIYCDFAGYTDIAIGSAELLGIRLGENFRQPYRARSLGEFWRRWHISLGTWFRDYLYLPLGGKRGIGAILAVFLLSGLWHGPNWTFVVWGGLHGLLLLLETWTSGWRQLLSRVIGTWWQAPLTFVLVALLWLPFRAQDLAQAAHLLGKMAQPGTWTLEALDVFGNRLDFAWCMGLVGLVALIDWADARTPLADRLGLWPRWGRWAVYYVLIFLVLIMGLHAQQPFMYFQF